jgi:predicted GTPase
MVQGLERWKNPISGILAKISDPSLRRLVENVEQEFLEHAPTIRVVGLSGVGKSSTINAMFGTSLKVSATTRGTAQFEKVDAELSVKNEQAKGKAGLLRMYDAPGLGEDRRLDDGYLAAYEK